MSSSTHSLTTEVVPESDIARQINEHHQLASSAMSSAAEHAYECGVILAQVKASLEHGRFQSWIESNCDFTYRHANRYMAIALNMTRASLSHNSSIRKALAAIASDPSKESAPKEPQSMAKRCRRWSEILESFSRRKQVTFTELAETVGMKNPEKLKRYATQWEDASGLVIEKTDNGVSVKSGGDAVVAIFEQLPLKTKRNTLQRLHLDDEVVDKQLREFKRDNKTVSQHTTEMLHSALNSLHGIVQQYRGKESSFCKVTEEQAGEIFRVYSLIESTVKDVEEIILKGLNNGVSKE